MDTNEKIVSLAVNLYKGNPVGEFSQSDSMETLRKALVAANNGSTKISYKDIRDGKCNGVFAIVEEVIQRTVVDGIQGDEFFMNMVDYRNVKLGDENDFYVPSKALFVVSEVANGVQSLRRQRLNGGEHVTVKTSLKAVKIYEELNRVLSGRVDFNTFIDRVSESYKQQMRADIYNAWCTYVGNGSTYFPVAGTYSEDGLLEMVNHVEAATGKSATIIGTKAALRKIKIDTVSDEAKSDMYNIGYYGKFNGTNCVKVNQIHKPGTTDFLLDDKKLYVIATDDKPIKVVTEGEPTIILGNPADNADLTQEFFYGESYGVSIVMADQFGVYSMS